MIIDGKNYGFTQPICAARWNQDFAVDGRPTVDVATDQTGSGQVESCCYCNRLTVCGIYVRIDPSTVPYPMEKE